MNKRLRLSLRIFAWIIVFIVFLVMLLFVFLQTKNGQAFAKNKAVNYLEKKIGTDVEIGTLRWKLPDYLLLEDVYIEDQSQDTLLAAEKLYANIKFYNLLSKKLVVDDIDLEGATININRGVDTVFNFDYILEAFIGEKSSSAPMPKQPSAKKGKGGFEISLNTIDLDRVRFRMEDTISGNNVALYVNHFDTQVNEFDLENQSYDVPVINLDGLKTSIIQTKPLVEPQDTGKTAEPLDLKLALKDIAVTDIDVDYQNKVSALESAVRFRELLVSVNNIDLENETILINSIKLDSTAAKVLLGNTEQAALVAKEVEETVQDAAQAADQQNWVFNVQSIDLTNTDFQYDNNTSAALPSGIDFNHLDITGLNLAVEDLDYKLERTTASIKSLTAKEESGLDIQSFKGDLTYKEQSIEVQNFSARTPRSYLSRAVKITYPNLEMLATNPGVMGLNAKIRDSRISVRDLLLFAPDLAVVDPFQKNKDKVFAVNGDVSGKISDLNFSGLEASGFQDTYVLASGNIRGLPDAENARYNFDIQKLATSRTDINQMLSEGIIPKEVTLPQDMSVNGTFNGSFLDFDTRLNLTSSFGNATADGALDFSKVGSEAYDGKVSVSNFDFGKLTGQDSLIGPISANATVKGVGIDLKTADAVFSAELESANYNNYNYRGLSLQGKANSGLLSGTANMADPNLTFDLTTEANFNGAYPAITATLLADSVDVQQLNFFDSPLKLHAKADIDLDTADPNFLNGNIVLSEVLVKNETDRYILDSILLTSTASDTLSTLDLRSEILTADLKGHYQLPQIAPAMINVVNNYYQYLPEQKLDSLNYSPQQFDFNARIIDGPLLAQLVPGLTKLDTVSMTASFNSAQEKLDIYAIAPQVVFNGNTINNTEFTAATAASALNYDLTVDNVQSKNFQIPFTRLYGDFANNIMKLDLRVQDSTNNKNYQLAGALEAFPNKFEFRLNPDKLILDNENWQVADNNFFQYGKAGILAQNFSISNSGQSISINSTSNTPNSPLDIRFTDFDLHTVTKIMEQDSTFIGGIVNGEAQVKNFTTQPIFTADASVTNFSYFADTLGNITAKVNNATDNTLAANVELTGQGNQVSANGTYTISDQRYDMGIDIQNLNLNTIQGFSLGNVSRSKGAVKGQLDFNGTLNEPEIRGDVRFVDAGAYIKPAGGYFTLDNERINFTAEGINLDQFTLVDSLGSKAILDGDVYTTNYKDYRFNLDLDAKNFLVLDAERRYDLPYHGPLYVNTDVRLTGTMNNPIINGDLKVVPPTDYTVIVPQTGPTKADTDGVVVFFDQDGPNLDSLLNSQLDVITRTPLTGLTAAVSLDVDKDATLTIIIDEGNGDFLRVKGDADLLGSIDESGKVSLTGQYKLEDGAYELNFNTLRRSFNIQKGSTITWNGEPTDATLNITAIYVADTAPLDLLEQQLAGANQTIRNTYKQKLPFEVRLNLRGQLLKPEIRFDIVLPEGNYRVSRDIVDDIESKLQQLRVQPGELNKQVFALLLLNRFIGENPFASETGGISAEGLARQSVSRLITEQLNDFAGDLISGVDLQFDLESSEDYSTGVKQNRTALNVGLTKQLLNDRLSVTVGSSFDLEGSEQPGQAASNIAGDISANYALSADGRYMIRAYRKNEYEVAVQGQVIETGVGFIITLDYDHFSDIFRKKTDEEKRLEKEKKQEEKREKQEEKAREKAEKAALKESEQ